MKRSVLILFALFFFITITGRLMGDQRPADRGGSIRGYVIDAEFQTPLEYANIILYARTDSVLVTGTITDQNGIFVLTAIRPGTYFVEINFIGYQATFIEDIGISRADKNIDLGEIMLRQAVLLLEGAEVVADKPAIEYRIDKKVINVSKQYTAVSGTAVDVLENVPSVSVDIEGEVSLRGSSNFTVLINDRPTVLDPQEALQQIPASTIDNIEIITNPSARYDPDGTSGIINIITKKGGITGTSGIVNLNVGLDEKYGADFLTNYKTGNLNLHFGADYNTRHYPGTTETENRTWVNDTTYYFNSYGDSRWGRTFYSLRGGLDLHLTPRDILGSSVRFGDRSMGGESDLDYEEWSVPGSDRLRYTSINDVERAGGFYEVIMDYRHNFTRSGHVLSGQAVYSGRDGEEETTNELFDVDGNITGGQRSTEDGPSDRLRVKLDYTLPLGEEDQFESGYQSRLRRTEDITRSYTYDQVNGEYELLPEFSNSTEYTRDIHSLYTMYSGFIGRLNYQGGLRGEYTDRSTELASTGEKYIIDRWDYFPTAHISYKHSDIHQTMGSYTRRINRPRGWYLEPFETWTDAYNVRKGNPALKPEYIDSYELGYQANLGSNLFSVEAYYRVTHNKIERVRTVYAPNIILHTMENVGTDYAFGTELMSDISVLDWWNLNLMGNIYDYRIEGVLYQESFSQESFDWSMRLNNTLKFSKRTRIQINGVYRSATVTAQGRRGGFFTTDAAVKHDFVDGKLSATLQLRDILNTAKYEFTSEGPNFSYYRLSDRKSPMVTLTVTYNFNNHKPERRQRSNGEDMQEGGEF